MSLVLPFSSSVPKQFLTVLGSLVLAVLLLSTGCSDDPILGPGDDSSDDSGGSYSVIKRLAPQDSAQVPPPPKNPKQF